MQNSDSASKNSESEHSYAKWQHLATRKCQIVQSGNEMATQSGKGLRARSSRLCRPPFGFRSNSGNARARNRSKCVETCTLPPLDSELVRLGRAWSEFPVDFESSWTNLKGLGYDLEPSPQKSRIHVFGFQARSLQIVPTPKLHVGESFC